MLGCADCPCGQTRLSARLPPSNTGNAITMRYDLTRRGLIGGGAILASLPRIKRLHAEPAPIPEDLVKAAQKEGTLNYYHNSDIDTTNLWTAAFTKKYGVNTKNMRLPSYPLYDRWLNEERVGRHVGDLIQITDSTLLSAAAKQGFIAHYEPPGADAIDPSLREDGVWYALTLDSMGIGYNGKKVTPDEERMIHEQGWKALEDPRWKGRFGTATPASGGSSYAFCYMFLHDLRDQYGPAFFRAMAANKPDIFASKAPLFERLAAGEYAIMDQGSQGTLSDYFLKGAASAMGVSGPDAGRRDGAEHLGPRAASQRRAAVSGLVHHAGGGSSVAQHDRRHTQREGCGRSAPARPQGVVRRKLVPRPDRTLYRIPETAGLRRSEEADHRRVEQLMGYQGG